MRARRLRVSAPLRLPPSQLGRGLGRRREAAVGTSGTHGGPGQDSELQQKRRVPPHVGVEGAVRGVRRQLEHERELIARNYEKAISILESSPHEVMASQFGFAPKSFQLGLIYYVMSNRELANKHFQEARQILEDELNELQDDSRLYSSLGIVYAGLGMREEARTAGNKALAIMNISVDAIRGFFREWDMAWILLMIGEYDEAIAKLEFLLQQNGFLSVELLKKEPFWDPIREMDAFKELIENPKYQINLDDD